MHTIQTSSNHTQHTPTHPTNAHIAHSSWAMESLLKKAFARTKSRFLSMLLSSLLTMFVICGVILVTAFLAGIALLAFAATSQYLLMLLVGIIGLVVTAISITFVSVWGQLATIHLLINQHPRDIIGAWQHVRPHIKQAFIAQITMSLFLFGLIPLGFVSLFIPLIIWNFLFGFTLFIIISTQKSASEALWTSKDMMLSKFWGIVGRTILMWLLIQLISVGIILISTLFISDGTNPYKVMSVLDDLIGVIFNLLITPFTLAFMYEMYKLIPVPHTSKTPHKWIVASAIGIVVMMIGIVSIISYASTINWGKVSAQMNGIMDKKMIYNDKKFDRQPNRSFETDTDTLLNDL